MFEEYAKQRWRLSNVGVRKKNGYETGVVVAARLVRTIGLLLAPQTGRPAATGRTGVAVKT